MGRRPEYHDLADVELCARVDWLCITQRFKDTVTGKVRTATAEAACNRLAARNYTQLLERPGGLVLRVFSNLNAKRSAPRAFRETVARRWARILGTETNPELVARIMTARVTDYGKDPAGALRHRYQVTRRRLAAEAATARKKGTAGKSPLVAHYQWMLEAYLDQDHLGDLVVKTASNKKPVHALDVLLGPRGSKGTTAFARVRDAIRSRENERAAERGEPPPRRIIAGMMPAPFTLLSLMQDRAFVAVPCLDDSLLAAWEPAR